MIKYVRSCLSLRSCGLSTCVSGSHHHGPRPHQSSLHSAKHQCLAKVERHRMMDQRRCYFWEPSIKGYTKYDHTQREMAEIAPEDIVKWGSKIFVDEVKSWVREWRDHARQDRPIYEPQEEIAIWKFDNQETLDEWIVSKDSDWGEGFSTAVFERSPAGHALFHGFVDTKTFPKDRMIARVGWVFVSCPPAKRPFMQEGYYDWSGFTHMILRVRGDGRTYAINIRTPGTFNYSYFDVYSYGLYTHGGPYWQYVRVPLSKFIFTARGSVQDYQDPIDLMSVRSFGIGLLDKIHGPFKLEIDVIALEIDLGWDSAKAQYEMYHVPQSKYPGY